MLVNHIRRMIHQHICRISGPSKDLAFKHFLQALFQSEQDKPSEIVFGPTCSKPDGEFTWSVEGSRYSLGMPPGICGSQVRETLITTTGLDDSTVFPKELEFVLEVPQMPEFILEFPSHNDSKYDTDEPITWQRMRWRVLLASREGRIIFRRLA